MMHGICLTAGGPPAGCSVCQLHGATLVQEAHPGAQPQPGEHIININNTSSAKGLACMFITDHSCFGPALHTCMYVYVCYRPQGLSYSTTAGDEVEDLFTLLAYIKVGRGSKTQQAFWGEGVSYYITRCWGGSGRLSWRQAGASISLQRSMSRGSGGCTSQACEDT